MPQNEGFQILVGEDRSKNKKIVLWGSLGALAVIALAVLSLAYGGYLGNTALRSLGTTNVSVGNIVYSSTAEKKLKFATDFLGNWNLSNIDNLNNQSYPSVVTDGKGSLHVSYYDGSAQVIKYATNASGKWVSIVIDKDAAPQSSIAIDPSGKLHIAYASKIIGAARYPYYFIKHATNFSGKWVSGPIDKRPVTPTSISIAADSQNKLHIAYGDNLRRVFVYATGAITQRFPLAWSSVILDKTSQAGLGASLKTDARGKVHLSYYDVNSLKYATNSSGKWAIKILDKVAINPNNPGFNTSLALDGQGRVGISYSNLATRTVNYLNNFSGAWKKEVVGNSTVFSNSLAFDSEGMAYVSYVDKGVLKLAANSSGKWVAKDIDKATGDSALAVTSKIVESKASSSPSSSSIFSPLLPYGPYSPYSSSTPTPETPTEEPTEAPPTPTGNPPSPYSAY